MRISVALCTYNGEKYLGDQLTSIATQSRLPDELVVCDDGSRDGTMALLKKFAATAPFAVCIHENLTNLGSTKNFEQAFTLCSGDLIAPADQDDYWLPGKLARIEQVFAADPAINLVITDGFLVDATLAKSEQLIWANLPFTPAMQRQFEGGAGPAMLLRYNLVTGAAMAFRATLRPSVLPIPACWVHDAWIGFLATALGPARVIPEPLVLYRQHTTQQIGILPLTWKRQFDFARRMMNLAYFARQAECFRALADRLTTLQEHLRDPALLDATLNKVALAETQVAMRQTNRLHRLCLATRELLTGHYQRHGRGFKSFVVDALF